ncbi:hypothetical protein GCM10025857_28140 [Alicyclobacillus contaminans]|nr:hypothetical protein GCM10025857_28140 [Alicyclobacillus contaminans]
MEITMRQSGGDGMRVRQTLRDLVLHVGVGIVVVWFATEVPATADSDGGPSGR